MADTVTTQVIEDGPRRAVLKFTNKSDGTGEAAVKKVDLTTLSGNPARVSIDAIWAATNGMAVEILWEGTPATMALIVPDMQFDDLCFKDFGGIHNNAASATGNILFTTIGAAAGHYYTIILYLKKN